MTVGLNLVDVDEMEKLVSEQNLSSDFIISTTETNKLCIPYKDIMEFKEMHPPDIMPQVLQCVA